MLNFLTRTAELAVKLPFTITFDALTLCNGGDGSKTAKVLKDWDKRNKHDDASKVAERLK